MDNHSWRAGIGCTTSLPTPDGWVKASDIRVGSWVLGASGAPQQVEGVLRGTGPGFSVGLNGGVRIQGGPDLVLPAERRPNGGKDKRDRRCPTRLADLPGCLVRHGARVFRVANAEPIALPDATLPLDPYILGAWLGDGETGNAVMAGIDPETIAAFEHAGYPVTRKANGRNWRPKGLLMDLGRAGVLDRKHIPAAYLRASEPQRRALLQGLMDTDGTCETRGICEYTTILPALRDGIVELLHTLGYKVSLVEGDAKLYGRVTNRKYRIKFSPRRDRAVFRLERKQSRVLAAGGTHSQTGHRRIESIEPVEHLNLVAIAVDSPDGSFLAGPAMVPVLGVRT